MTLNEIYTQGKNILTDAGRNAPAFDAMRIFELCFNLNRQDIILYRNDVPNESNVNKFFELIYQRAKGRPLQYILGYWNFMDIQLKIGEGVLIPRDDTEVLVSTVQEYIQNINEPQILDLCAGPGTIAISLAKQHSDAHITAIDVSELALSYLLENIELNGVKNVTPFRCDILNASEAFSQSGFDIIVSNPPYIPTKDLSSLQVEVQREPLIALDGGEDGLIFYRAIAKNWTKFLKVDGMLCVEVGLGQAKNVAEIFVKAGLQNIEVRKDLNNVRRVVVAQKYH